MCCSPIIHQEATVAGAEGAGGQKGGQGWRMKGVMARVLGEGTEGSSFFLNGLESP